jgi:hypothetical protein
MKTIIVILSLFLASMPAISSPIYICYTNKESRVMNLDIYLPYNNAISNTTVNSGVNIREGGDSDGPYCISATYAGDARDCPVDQPDTTAGLQVELQCQ